MVQLKMEKSGFETYCRSRIDNICLCIAYEIVGGSGAWGRKETHSGLTLSNGVNTEASYRDGKAGWEKI